MSEIAQAASVLLARAAGSAEVYVVRRAPSLRFYGGFLAFPGGKVGPGDRDAAGQRWNHPEPPPPVPLERYVTAIRELFEETGILLARRSDGSFPPSSPALVEQRRQLTEERASLADVLTELDLGLWGGDLTPLGDLITPPFVPTRFDTTFFLARQPPNQRPEIWPGELDEGFWTTPDSLLDAWTRGECLMSPPTIRILESLRGQFMDGAPARLHSVFASAAGQDLPEIFYAPDVQLIPLLTYSIPPSTHTNAYLVGGQPAYLIDPGTAKPEEQQRLFALLDAKAAAGRKPSAIVLTHHHPDHVGAASACSRRYGIPIHAHPRTTSSLRGKVEVSYDLHEGDRLPLGPTPDGRGSWYLQAIHTPGHAPGHLAFYEPYYRLLFAGDMVSTLSSIVITPPPEGDLAVYLESLERLKTYDCRLLLPGHGGPTAQARQTIEDCIAHRRKRENQLVAALSNEPRTVADLTQELYQGVHPKLARFAEWQVLAGLRKLESEGRAAPDEGDTKWHRIDSS